MALALTTALAGPLHSTPAPTAPAPIVATRVPTSRLSLSTCSDYKQHYGCSEYIGLRSFRYSNASEASRRNLTICSGQGSTGTKSLAKALSMLGLKSMHSLRYSDPAKGIEWSRASKALLHKLGTMYGANKSTASAFPGNNREKG